MSELKVYDFPIDHGFYATVEDFYLKAEPGIVGAAHVFLCNYLLTKVR